MPESIFGRPSHLLPSHPPKPPVVLTSQAISATQGTHLAPPKIDDLRFQTIGKQPALLSRITQPDPAATSYRSPSPSPVSPSAVASNIPTQSSRPSLLQQLTDVATSNSAGAHQANRDQSNVFTPSQSLLSTTATSSLLPSPATSRSGNAHSIPPTQPRANRVKSTTTFHDIPSRNTLIPPIEILPQPTESNGLVSPPFNQSQSESAGMSPRHVLSMSARAGLMGDVSMEIEDPKPANSTPAAKANSDSPAGPNTTSSGPLSSDAPILKESAGSSTPVSPSRLSVVAHSRPVANESHPITKVDTHSRGSSQRPSTPVLDSLSKCRARLLAIKDNIASIPTSSQTSTPPIASPSPDHSANGVHDITPRCENRPEEESGSVPSVHPHQSTNRPLSGDANQSITTEANIPVSSTASQDSVLSLEFQTHTTRIVEAVQSLTSTLSAAHAAHAEASNVLAQRKKMLEERRSAFEQKKRADEATYHIQLQELSRDREALREREAGLAALEKEHQVREEARRVVHAQRQAQEEKRRATVEAQVHEMEEQVTIALKEVEALKAQRTEERCPIPVERLQPVPVDQDVPTEVQEGMTGEEVKTIKERNMLLTAMERIRLNYEQKTRLLERLTSTLLQLQERKRRAAEELEHKRVAEEMQQRVEADERLRQVATEEQQKLTMAQAERERIGVEAEQRRVQAAQSANRNAAQLLAEQQAHAEAQVLQSQVPVNSTDQVLERRRQEEFNRRRAEVMTLKQQANAENAARIRAAREGMALPPLEGHDPAVAAESSDFLQTSLSSVVPSSTDKAGDTLSSPQSSKKTPVVSGGVILSTQSGNMSGVTSKPTTSNGKATAVTSKHPSFVSASTEVGRQVITDAPLFPIQLASELNNASSANADSYRTLTSPPRQSPEHHLGTQGLLEVGSQELSLGPQPSVSPAQRIVNLRHLKRARNHVEDGGNDRSVIKGSVKVEDDDALPCKEEEGLEPPSLLVQRESKLPPDQQESAVPRRPPTRPAVIPPPRPKISSKQSSTPVACQTMPAQDVQRHSCSNKSEVIGAASNGRLLAVSTQPPRASPSPWVMDASAERQEWAPQLTPPSPTPAEVENSMHVDVHEPVSEPIRRDCCGAVSVKHEEERRSQGSATGRDYRSISPVSPAISFSGSGDSNRDDGRQQVTRATERTRTYIRDVDHYSPSKGSRATVRSLNRREFRRTSPRFHLPSPVAGKKRRSESVDMDYSRFRRRRDEYTSDRNSRDTLGGPSSYARRKSPSPEHPSARRRSPSPVSPRSNVDAWFPKPESPLASAEDLVSSRYAPQRDTFHRRVEERDQHYRHQRPAPTALPSQSFGSRGQEVHQVVEDHVDDPLLLARMSDTQHFTPSTTFTRGRGRAGGRGAVGRGGGITGRGRGEPARSARNRDLLQRLSTAPTGSTNLGMRLS